MIFLTNIHNRFINPSLQSLPINNPHPLLNPQQLFSLYIIIITTLLFSLCYLYNLSFNSLISNPTPRLSTYILYPFSLLSPNPSFSYLSYYLTLSTLTYLFFNLPLSIPLHTSLKSPGLSPTSP